MKKSFWKTSEWWITVFATVGSIATAAVGLVPVTAAATVAAIATGAYAISRGLSKAGNGK
mgnify:CR=1 FL=1